MATVMNNTGIYYPDSNYHTTAYGNRQYITEAVFSNSASVGLYTSDSYANYEAVFSNVVAATNATTFQCLLDFNAAWQSGNYYYNAWHGLWSNNSGNQYGGQHNYIPLCYPGYFLSTASSGLSGYFRIYNCRTTTQVKNYEWMTTGYTWTTGGGGEHEGGGYYNDASNNGLAKMDGMLFYPATGNFLSGKITLYGWN